MVPNFKVQILKSRLKIKSPGPVEWNSTLHNSCATTTDGDLIKLSLSLDSDYSFLLSEQLGFLIFE